MLYVLLIHIGMDQFEITISMVNYLLYVIIIMLIYGIKIIRKMPIILTVKVTFAADLPSKARSTGLSTNHILSGGCLQCQRLDFF
jgi:hypothetical protein